MFAFRILIQALLFLAIKFAYEMGKIEWSVEVFHTQMFT